MSRYTEDSEGLAGHVAQLILSDDTDQTARIVRDYNAADTATRAAIDNIFISLCGYSLKTIIAGGAQ